MKKTYYMKKKLKINFGTWSIFDVGDHFYLKKLWKVKILTFEGEV